MYTKNFEEIKVEYNRQLQMKNLESDTVFETPLKNRDTTISKTSSETIAEAEEVYDIQIRNNAVTTPPMISITSKSIIEKLPNLQDQTIFEVQSINEGKNNLGIINISNPIASEERILEKDMYESDLSLDSVDSEVVITEVCVKNERHLQFHKAISDFFNPTTNYPERFPHIMNNIAGISLSEHSFKTLFANTDVDDNVINSFSLMMSYNAKTEKNVNVLHFKTFLVSSILNKSYISLGYRKWIMRCDMSTADIWILPVHEQFNKLGHWSLFVIYAKYKLIIYIDSLHKKPEVEWWNRLCSYIEKYYLNNLSDWNEWEFMLLQMFLCKNLMILMSRRERLTPPL